jgi:sulfide:quinone oxidoreductase
MRTVVLGAGFGGLELTTALSERLGDAVDVVLVDQNDEFVFGFSKLDVMFGRTVPDAVRHPYRDFMKRGATFVQSTVRSIDPVARRVETDAGAFEADVLVVALGADLDPSATPGLVEAGHEFYTRPGAFALRDVLADFGGGRVIVAVTSTPFKCPPAPSETALLMDDFLKERGIRTGSEVSLVMPMGVPIPPSPDASRALLEAFAERGIGWYPDSTVERLDPDRRSAVLTDGRALPYDLFLGIPKHRAPAVVVESGLTVDGWIPVDPLSLETTHPDVFAIGDVTSVGTPKAGFFAVGQAAVVAERLVARVRGERSSTEYDGHGICYLEFGHDEVAKVEVTFLSGEVPRGRLEGPSLALATDKAEFGSSRIRRWFDRSWPRSADLVGEAET